MATFADVLENDVLGANSPGRRLYLADDTEALTVKRTYSGLTKTGTGSGDLLPYGDHTHTSTKSYKVTIDTAGDENTATWGWSDDGGATYVQTNIPVNYLSRFEMQNGLTVVFAYGTYDLGDYWTFTAIATGDQALTLEVDTTSDSVTLGDEVILGRDSNIKITVAVGNLNMLVDTGDFLTYSRAGNEWIYYFGGTGYQAVGVGYENWVSISTPATPVADNGKLYAKLVGGKARPHWLDEDGVEINLAPIAKTKESDETITSSTTLQDDNDLTFAIAANEKWTFTMAVIYFANTTGDIANDISAPSGATIDWSATGYGYTDVFQQVTVTGAGTAEWGGEVLGSNRTILISGRIKNGSTPGDVKLRWAQRTSNAVGTIVRAGSCLTATRVI